MHLIDAHCHFWRRARGDYHWLDGEGGPLDPIRRDFLPADYPAQAGLIVVQAAGTVAETEYLLSLTDPRIRGVVGWVDLADPASADTLRRLSADPRFKGVRPMLQDIADTAWLDRAPDPGVLAALADLGLRFDALVTARHLSVLARFAARNPDLPIVIDHAAKPQPGPRDDWQAGMAAMAADPRIMCKLSGLLTELSPEQRRDPLPALRAIFDPLLDWFGADRLIWGSDWPVVTLAASHADWAELTDSLLENLSRDERRAILSGNAARFYGVTE